MESDKEEDEKQESRRRQYKVMTERIKRWNKFLDEKGVHEQGES